MKKLMTILTFTLFSNLFLSLFLGNFYFSALAAQDKSGAVKSGEIPLIDYLESVSDALGIQINATSADKTSTTLVSVAPLKSASKDQILTQLYTLLSLQGYSLIFDEKIQSYHLMRSRDARDANLPIITELSKVPDNDSLLTYVLKTKSVSPDAVARILRNFSPPTSRIVPFEAAHSVIISDTARSMSKYQDIVSKMDNPQAAQEFEKDFEKRNQDNNQCSVEDSSKTQNLILVLFGLFGVILGFLIRGYVIRRIEGGL